MTKVRKIRKAELNKACRDTKKEILSLFKQHCAPSLVAYRNTLVIYTTANFFDYDKKNFVKGKYFSSLEDYNCLIHKTYLKEFISFHEINCPNKENKEEYKEFFNSLKEQVYSNFRREFNKLDLKKLSIKGVLTSLLNESLKQAKKKQKMRAKKKALKPKKYMVLILKETSVEDIINIIEKVLNKYKSINYDIRLDINNKLHHSASARSCLTRANELLKFYGLNNKIVFIDKLLAS